MGKAKKTRKFAEVKRMLKPKEAKITEVAHSLELLDLLPDSHLHRVTTPQMKHKANVLTPGSGALVTKLPRNVPNVSSALFFAHNSALGPPYQVLVDTNFINLSIQNKLSMEKAMMDCLYANCTPFVTDCVLAELEKLGQKYRVALRLAKEGNVQRLPCTHEGTYADDCLVQRVTAHKCYIVATCDRDLKRRIRKIPGVPIMFISAHRYSIERLPEATIGGAPRT